MGLNSLQVHAGRAATPEALWGKSPAPHVDQDVYSLVHLQHVNTFSVSNSVCWGGRGVAPPTGIGR